MPDTTLPVVTPDSARELNRMRRKIDGVRAVSPLTVKHTPDGMVFSFGGRSISSSLPAVLVAKVVSSSRDGSNWRWIYTVQFLAKTSTGYGGWAAIPGEDNVTAYNLNEDINGASGLLGNGIDTTNLTGTFEPQPVPDGDPVFMYLIPLEGEEMSSEWWFTEALGIDGACS